MSRIGRALLQLRISEDDTHRYRREFDAFVRGDFQPDYASIAKSLRSIDSKMVKRPARVILCKHPELHPELETTNEVQ